MVNDRLRDAFQRKGHTPQSVSMTIGVDIKTVERWIRQGRTPYPRHRRAIAAMVGQSENYLWPDALPQDRATEISSSEVVQVYPHRHQVPRQLWTMLFGSADRQLDILVYSGLFLTEDPCLPAALRTKTANGAKARILFGDPKSREVARRSAEEGIGGGTIAAKIHNSISFFEPILDTPGLDIRLHKTTLYNSIYRFDDEMLVNTHILGRMAAHSPVLHIKRLDGGSLFDMYAATFDSVWNESKALPCRSPVEK